MSWTTYTVYNFADDLHWPELGILLEIIDYHEAARKASFLGSMCEDSLMAAINFERRFDALMKYVINSQEHTIGKVKDFIYRVGFKIRGSCHYLVTAYFFWIENIPQDISCDTRDVLVQYINSVIKTDIPDESDVELYQLVKRLQTHSHSKYLKKNTTFIWSFQVSFYFTNHLIANQVDYASSELHDSTQRKEIFPTTKTYCSFNKNFAGLLILMQCFNKLYLFHL